MALVKKVTKHGNSAGVIFDQPILKHMGWDVGTEVEIQLSGSRLILTRHEVPGDDEVKASAAKMVARHRKALERLSR